MTTTKLSYTFEQMLKLKESPLVIKPPTLPEIPLPVSSSSSTTHQNYSQKSRRNNDEFSSSSFKSDNNDFHYNQKSKYNNSNNQQNGSYNNGSMGSFQRSSDYHQKSNNRNESHLARKIRDHNSDKSSRNYNNTHRNDDHESNNGRRNNFNNSKRYNGYQKYEAFMDGDDQEETPEWMDVEVSGPDMNFTDTVDEMQRFKEEMKLKMKQQKYKNIRKSSSPKLPSEHGSGSFKSLNRFELLDDAESVVSSCGGRASPLRDDLDQQEATPKNMTCAGAGVPPDQNSPSLPSDRITPVSGGGSKFSRFFDNTNNEIGMERPVQGMPHPSTVRGYYYDNMPPMSLPHQRPPSPLHHQRPPYPPPHPDMYPPPNHQPPFMMGPQGGQSPHSEMRPLSEEEVLRSMGIVRPHPASSYSPVPSQSSHSHDMQRIMHMLANTHVQQPPRPQKPVYGKSQPTPNEDPLSQLSAMVQNTINAKKTLSQEGRSGGGSQIMPSHHQGPPPPMRPLPHPRMNDGRPPLMLPPDHPAMQRPPHPMHPIMGRPVMPPDRFMMHRPPPPPPYMNFGPLGPNYMNGNPPPPPSGRQ